MTVQIYTERGKPHSIELSDSIDEAALAEAEQRIKRAATIKANTVDLSNLGLTQLPDSLFKLSYIKTLIISKNKLTFLPESLGQLTELESIYAFSNHLVSLPESIGQLKQLEILCISDNELTDLPESLLELTSLKDISLAANEALNLPAELVHHNSGMKIYITDPRTTPYEILNYYFRTRRGRKPLNEAKLILVGRGGVGKTCIIKQLIDGTFNEKEPETPGIEIHSWPVTLSDGDLVRLHVWDFGGQEILHATHQFFLTERTIYLLVLSGREGNPTQDAEYWLQLIRSFGNKSKVIIVLNKSILHPFDVNRGLLFEKYPSLIADFVKTDCNEETGLLDLNKMILQLAEQMEHRKAAFPADWFDIKERLSSMEENFITWDQYQAICRGSGELGAEAQRSLASFLHILGIALNYREDPRLRDTHVLNPRWVTEGIYTLLRAAQNTKYEGVIEKADLENVLDLIQYPKDQHDFMLRLMEKFQLCFELIKDSGRYLVPELLGENQPDLKTFLDEPGLDFRYQYEILPEGLLPRFIVQTHRYSESRPQWRWRTGVVLELENCIAIVRADPSERRVDIHITGLEPLRRSALAIIRGKFSEQHSDLKGLTVDERVPIPGEYGVTVSYHHLRELEEDGEIEYRPEGMRRKISVTDLLNGVEDVSERNQNHLEIIQSEKTTDQNSYITIGIITALPKEFIAMKTAMIDCFEHNIPGQGAGRRYVLGKLPSLHGGDHCIALALADMGNNIASSRASLLLEHFSSVETIIMVGIAGGVPSPNSVEDHVRLGDIVISNKKGVVQYDLVKLSEIRTCNIAPNAKLLEGIRLLEAGELEQKRPWDKYIDDILTILKQRRPSQTRDRLFDTKDPEVQLYHPKDPKRLRNIPRVFLGPIASANELLKDPIKRDSLRNQFGVKAVEMEGSGVADATWLHERGYLVIRGICDYCDSHKSNDWQDYAAAVAAGYTKALIESLFI